MPLNFHKLADCVYLPHELAVCFEGQSGNSKVPCRITAKAMQDVFGEQVATDGTAFMNAFKIHRPTIEKAASKKFDLGQKDEQGGVTLLNADFNF